MAETAATVVGIGGAVAVLQSLLKAYNDFLTARDFPEDFAFAQLRVALLDNATTTWAIAVGLIDESGSKRGEFLVPQPTESRINLVEETLELIQMRLGTASGYLDQYPSDEAAPQDGSGTETSHGSGVNPERGSLKAKVANRLRRMFHQPRDPQHPGTLKRTKWTLIDKNRLDGLLDKITQLVDRLNADFVPDNWKQQLNKYYADIKELGWTEEELEVIGGITADRVSKKVLERLRTERLTSNTYEEFNVDGSVMNVGNHVSENWTGEVPEFRLGDPNRFGNVNLKNGSVANIGHTFGGESPAQSAMKMLAARWAKSEEK
ncbi:hypothetical protein ABW19_dt0202813 [Dactylella cylindrospora]|nr:hypothetical protein ABW19_dt0202813 [Dactylella cylindrospora]